MITDKVAHLTSAMSDHNLQNSALCINPFFTKRDRYLKRMNQQSAVKLQYIIYSLILL